MNNEDKNRILSNEERIAMILKMTKSLNMNLNMEKIEKSLKKLATPV